MKVDTQEGKKGMLKGEKLAKINNEYLKIWGNNHSDKEATKRFPLAYPELKKSAVLFVGLNPSFSNEIWSRIMGKEKPFDGKDASTYFNYHDNRNKYDLDVAINAEKEARAKHVMYFKQIRSIGEYFDISVEHIDMFAYRETSAKKCLGNVMEKEGKLTPFGKDQYDVFCDLVSLLEPIALVVINASASRIFKQEITTLEYDKKSGVYWLEQNSRMKIKNKVPIFFSGMLSGQHSLDISSRDRLYWHLEQELKNNYKLKNDYNPDLYRLFCKKEEEGEKRPMAD